MTACGPWGSAPIRTAAIEGAQEVKVKLQSESARPGGEQLTTGTPRKPSRTSANVAMFRLALILVSLASAKGSCDDLDGWKTDNGKGCGWIEKKPEDRCSEVGETSEDVKADRACAACGNVAADVATGVRSAREPPPSPEVTEHPNLI